MTITNRCIFYDIIIGKWCKVPSTHSWSMQYFLGRRLKQCYYSKKMHVFCQQYEKQPFGTHR
jgi:hypothetical protein